MLEVAKEVCGETKPGRKGINETWWWNEEVQEKIKNKKLTFKEWQKSGSNNKKEDYNKAKTEAKRAVAKARYDAWQGWYDELDTKEGEKAIYKIAKRKIKSTKDIGQLKVIRDHEGNLVTRENKIKERWREYFDTLLNIENDRDQLIECEANEGPIPNVSELEVKEALKQMKTGKSVGSSGISTDLIKGLKDIGVNMIKDTLEMIWREERVPKEWLKSEIVPIYKQKGDPLECGNYRGIKILEHSMKVLEKVLDKRLREIVDINEMQFGFRKGKGTTDAIFVVRQLQEKFLEKQKDLFMAFIDLEKAYDRVPRELVYWCLRKRKVPENLIKIIEATYERTETVVRTGSGNTEPFEIKVGLHQGSALSPFLFVIVLDTLSNEFRSGLPWELLFADDLVVIAQNEEELQEKLITWQQGMEKRGLKVNAGKTEVMLDSRNHGNIIIKDKSNAQLKQVKSFKYLGTTLNETGGSEDAVRARVSAAWFKWKEMSGVIQDKRIPRKLKVTVIRPVLLYGAETWTLRRKEEQLLETTEMRMLRRIKRVTIRDRIRSSDMRQELGVKGIVEIARQSRLRWYGHLMRMEEGNKVKEVWNMTVQGNRPRGRPKKRWMDCVKSDMEAIGLREEDASNRELWRRKVQTPDLAAAGQG